MRQVMAVILGAEEDLLWRRLVTYIHDLREPAAAHFDGMGSCQGQYKQERCPRQVGAVMSCCQTTH